VYIAWWPGKDLCCCSRGTSKQILSGAADWIGLGEMGKATSTNGVKRLTVISRA